MSKKKEHDSRQTTQDSNSQTKSELTDGKPVTSEDLKNAEGPTDTAEEEGKEITGDSLQPEDKADENTPEPGKTPEEIIDELKNEIKAAADRYLRLMAEFDNYKKRTSREFERMIESANEKLMIELISVRETFELAITHGEKGSDYKQLLDGIKLLFNKFDGILKANGLVPFAAIGDPFDPEIHDALMKMPHNDIPENHIVDIHEKGYRLKDRIVKHAKVIVSSGKPDIAPANGADGSEECKNIRASIEGGS